MAYEIYYLPFGGDTRLVRDDLLYGDKDLTPELFAEHYEKIGTDDQADDLSELWARWNRGSGQECETLQHIECEGGEDEACDETFNSPERAKDHERETGHATTAPRSMSSGDVVVEDDGTVWFCARIGWEKRDSEIVDGHSERTQESN